MESQLSRIIAIAATIFLFGSAAFTAPPDVTEAATRELAGLSIVDLQLIPIEGILIVRGKVRSETDWREVQQRLDRLGYPRVANMTRIVPFPPDQEIAREAERILGLARGLRGAKLRVSAENGIVTLQGTVRSDAQRDAAAEIISRIEGVRAVRDETRRG